MREQQAETTRATILGAARRIFAERGYAGASVEAIASTAAVSTRTIYVAFDSKLSILAALVEGLKDEIDVGGMYRELIAEPRAPEKLRLSAAITRRYSERGWDLLEILRGAGAADRDLGTLWTDIEQRRLRGQTALVRSLADASALRADLDIGEAADTLWALSAHDVYRLFVGERGWTPQQFEDWLFATTRRLLLGR